MRRRYICIFAMLDSLIHLMDDLIYQRFLGLRLCVHSAIVIGHICCRKQIPHLLWKLLHWKVFKRTTALHPSKGCGSQWEDTLNMVYMITSLGTKVDSSTNYVINFIHKTILQRAIRTMLLKKINQSSSTHRNNHLSLLPLLSKTTSITTKQLSVEEDGAYLHFSLKGDWIYTDHLSSDLLQI